MDSKKTETEFRCTIAQQPFGWPKAGQFAEYDGSAYRVLFGGTRIFTGRSGTENYVYATVESVEWDDVPEGENVWAIMDLGTL
jgi:hypothetical protein